MDRLKAFLRETSDEAIWATWLYFHPFANFRLKFESEEYKQQRSEVLRRFHASMA